MLQSTAHLIGFSLSATDGEIGKVKDFYFDDNTWKIRYLVVETGNWLFGRKVLIAPHAILHSLEESRTIAVSMTKEQVKNSPDIDTDKPVSKQSEADLYQHYAWPYGSAGMGYPSAAMITGAAELSNEMDNVEHHYDKHLRSYKHITDYKVYNEDGPVGDTEDFLLNTEDWTLPYLIVHTPVSSSNEKTVIPTRKIRSIDLNTYMVLIDLSTASLASSLKIAPGGFLSEEQQQRLFNNFD